MMAAVRVSFLKSGFSYGSQTFTSNFTKLTNRIPNQSHPNSVSRRLDVDSHFRVAPLQSLVDNRHYRVEPVSAFSHRCLQNNGFMNLSSWKSSFPLGATSSYRAYSSFFGGKGDGEVSAGSVANGSNVDGNNVVGTDWVDNLKTGLQSVVDSSVYTGGKAKEAADELTPHFHQLLESHPYLKDVIIPVGGTLTGTLFAWVVLPRVLRKFHKYSVQSAAALWSGNLPQEHIPYEKSAWGALEDPVRYLASFIALSYLGVLIAPTTITIQYMPGVCRGAAVGALMWFFFRLKNNVLSRSLAGQSVAGLDRESWLAIDKFLSVGLIGLGLMSIAEACGVAVQSIVTVGGIGGVATAFAARDILGNMLSGLSMQFSKPFSLGDTIKAGSIEGQVIEMGLTTTSLLNAEKFPVLVPNSLFSSQVIVNKSRAQWRAMLTKVPLRIDNFENIPQISEDIKFMLSSNANIFLGKEAPYCFLSRIENSFAELTIGCNLKHMTKDELYSTQQDILLQAAKIIKQHGAALGSTSQDLAYQ